MAGKLKNPFDRTEESVLGYMRRFDERTSRDKVPPHGQQAARRQYRQDPVYEALQKMGVKLKYLRD